MFPGTLAVRATFFSTTPKESHLLHDLVPAIGIPLWAPGVVKTRMNLCVGKPASFSMSGAPPSIASYGMNLTAKMRGCKHTPSLPYIGRHDMTTICYWSIANLPEYSRPPSTLISFESFHLPCLNLGLF
jgi:hypothetical protein